MFGFVSKFKNEVIAGFESVHQRLITLEVQVKALFEHTKTQVQEQAADVKTNVTAVADNLAAKVDTAETVAGDVAKTVEDAKG